MSKRGYRAQSRRKRQVDNRSRQIQMAKGHFNLTEKLKQQRELIKAEEQRITQEKADEKRINNRDTVGISGGGQVNRVHAGDISEPRSDGDLPQPVGTSV